MSIELTNLEASRMYDLLVESEKLRHRIAELERALKSAAEYFEMLKRATGVDHGNLKEINAVMWRGGGEK